MNTTSNSINDCLMPLNTKVTRNAILSSWEISAFYIYFKGENISKVKTSIIQTKP